MNQEDGATPWEELPPAPTKLTPWHNRHQIVREDLRARVEETENELKLLEEKMGAEGLGLFHDYLLDTCTILRVVEWSRSGVGETWEREGALHEGFRRAALRLREGLTPEFVADAWAHARRIGGGVDSEARPIVLKTLRNWYAEGGHDKSLWPQDVREYDEEEDVYHAEGAQRRLLDSRDPL